MQYHLAIDIGASSGRHILGHVDHGRIILEEIHRFDNLQLRKNGHDCWDTNELFEQVLCGLQKCKAMGKIPDTLGVDTWGVDFVLLDESGEKVGDAIAYRDKRTNGMAAALEKKMPFADLYAKSGIQKQSFNTIYQLLALKQEHPEDLQRARHLLMMPDYLHYLLTGTAKQEYTNATTSSLVNASTKAWNNDLLKALDLPLHLFGTLSEAGTPVGELTPQIQAQVGFNCTVVLPAAHDTASAFLAVPAVDENAVFISSGTWSLLGVELQKPITTPQSCAENFTNEGGYDYRYRFLKNITGPWMIQSIRRELNGEQYVKENKGTKQEPLRGKIGYAELEQEARNAGDFASIIDVNAAEFLSPPSMLEAVKLACKSSGQAVPQTTGEVMRCVYNSLALSYAHAIQTLSKVTGNTYTSINIVGGGSKDGYLNELTAKATGLPVLAGPAESTALGNLMAQFLFAGTFKSLPQARDAIRTSFIIKEITP